MSNVCHGQNIDNTLTRNRLGVKLRSDFDPDVRTSLDRGEVARVIALATHLRPVQAPVLAGDTALDALAHARDGAAKAPGMTASRVARFLGVTRAQKRLEMRGERLEVLTSQV